MVWWGGAGRGAWVRRSRVARRGVGRVGRSRLVSTAWTWEAGGNCTTWRFDTPATRRWKASCSAKPPFCSMRRQNQVPRWLRLGEAWAGLAVCGAFGLFSRFYLGSSGGCNGGNCSIRGATRRRHAAGRPRVVQNPHFARCVGRIRCPEGCGVPWRGRERRQFPTCVARESQDLPNGGVDGAGACR